MLRKRAAAAGLAAAHLADILDVQISSVYRALDRDAPEYRAIIAAWEIMSPDQRGAWLAELNVLAERRGRGRPRKAVVI